MATKAERLKNVNAFIKVIGSCGRRFFHDAKNDEFAYMEVDARGRIWYVDDYSKKRIYTHYTNSRWANFGHGGTLRDLIVVFRDHISKGTQIHSQYFNPDRYIGGGHHWGYPVEDLKTLHEAGVRLGIVATVKESAA